jgi:hypothetical protein
VKKPKERCGSERREEDKGLGKETIMMDEIGDEREQLV